MSCCFLSSLIILSSLKASILTITKNSFISLLRCFNFSLFPPNLKLPLRVVYSPKMVLVKLECLSISFFQFVLRLFIPQTIKQCFNLSLFLSSYAKYIICNVFPKPGSSNNNHLLWFNPYCIPSN